jgi:uncharacterized protein (DUF1800 family)
MIFAWKRRPDISVANCIAGSSIFIDDWTETNIIVPLANILRSNNYAVGPVLETLFKSAHFYDPLSMGCMIKSPIDYVVGMARTFGLGYPTDVVTKYKVTNYMMAQAAAMQQDLADPPSVAGWQAYYQSPQFYQTWINSDTLRGGRTQIARADRI